MNESHEESGFPPTTPDYSVRLGRVPLLVLSIHDNIARSVDNPERSREYRTRELNEDLHLEFGSYLFNYFGYRSEFMDKGIPTVQALVRAMIAAYGKIGIISLHRTNAYILDRDGHPIFSYGCLLGQTLDPEILNRLDAALGAKCIAFFEGERQIGGKEVRVLHTEHNDPNYLFVSMEKGAESPAEGVDTLADRQAFYRARNQHDPRTNVVQIIQVEFAWRVPGEDEKYIDRPRAVCRVLAEIMLGYLQQP